MMNKHTNTILYKVAAETLEQLAFFFVERSEDDDISETVDQAVTAMAAFHGPFSGCMGITMNLDLLPEMAANMLGIEDEEVSEQEQLDAFKEVANILCGNLLPKISGSEKVFNIDAPTILANIKDFDPAQMELVGDIVLDLDDTGCQLQLFFESPVPDELRKRLSSSR